MSEKDEILDNILLELRRGTIIISVLSQLSTPQYGYSLVQNLKNKGLSVDPGTLYPLLRRLEKQNILESKWDTGENKPRKYYSLSSYGEKIYKSLCDEWKNLSKIVGNLI